MTTQEMRELWDSLRSYFPNARQLQDRRTGNAWYEVLKPYAADDVKNAFISYMRQGVNYFPDVAQITALLPRLPSAPRGEERDATQAGFGFRTRYFTRKWDAMMAQQGYPSLAEWLGQGKPAAEWWEARGRCQSQDPEWSGHPVPQDIRR